ncbi:LuxR C-terminal-related transcriptional regulator [Bacillus thuringiensis]|mgnify:CR=1 FL=1|jgi:DNA-binding NarL/FixJ family response regulator|uniref:DNA-binding response regulator n=8 Tax=Bacillus cereus group TaxID=86661 RepID=A0A9W7Q9C8_BACCE|nr:MULTISPECIES: LuxR C-terminal-related transcriptional regulator [Bacillus]EAO54077.1 Transcriptional regulator, LuxR family [Bacillus thuringiensis serovar israelensis ATCC 35646]EEM41799.1 Transcriptional regulator, LuxR [Bacillus thuringiensis serovar sotto str. T04001]MED1156691.1 LuxR C-terminal-related transcriptional regulator [Bacillus paranthracis]ACK97810.1 transcriptional regulator, LuxR family [Bacillus cereus G9842]AFQ15031.1 LuxR family transcriptional regulator [Bacillus thuri
MKRILTERELEVAIYVAKGYTDAEISRKIYVTPRRISTIINHIKEKWHINSRVELGILVYHYGFIDAPLFSNKEIQLCKKVVQ